MAEDVKKIRVYECEHYEYEYDDLGKYAWCHSRNCLSRECIVDYKFCQDMCPFYARNAAGRYVEIEDDERLKEIRAGCLYKLRNMAEEALEDAVKEMKNANAKMAYAKHLRAVEETTI